MRHRFKAFFEIRKFMPISKDFSHKETERAAGIYSGNCYYCNVWTYKSAKAAENIDNIPLMQHNNHWKVQTCWLRHRLPLPVPCSLYIKSLKSYLRKVKKASLHYLSLIFNHCYISVAWRVRILRTYIIIVVGFPPLDVWNCTYNCCTVKSWWHSCPCLKTKPS